MKLLTMLISHLSNLIIILLCVTAVNGGKYKSKLVLDGKIKSNLEIDIFRTEYLSLEQSLWKYLEIPNLNKESQLKKVYDTHRNFVQKYLTKNFDDSKYYMLKHYEWTVLQHELLNVDLIFRFFRNFLDQHNSTTTYDNEGAALDFADNILKKNESESEPSVVRNIFKRIELIMVKQTMYYRATLGLESSDEICRIHQSPQQFLYSLYSDIALTEMKAYTMIKFSWMMLRIYGKGNFTAEAQLMDADYQRRNERTLMHLKEVMKRAKLTLWRCDPDSHIKEKTYDEITQLIQGYVENEIDMNYEETCREDCSFYESTKSVGCYQNQFCARQTKCNGKIHRCTFIDSDMTICPSAMNSTRRYEYIEYENGRTFGQKKTCDRGTIGVDSWWRYLFWHCSYCFCLCDSQGKDSDRYFNLRDTVSDTKNNKIITGLRFVKKNRVFHLQIQEAQLLPRGTVNLTTVAWKPLDDYRIFDRNVKTGRDFHTMSWENRAIDLDDIHADDPSFVVTGVRFRVLGAHLNLEAKLTEIDYAKGELKNIEFWKSNDNTDVSGVKRDKIVLHNPDVPTRAFAKSVVKSEHNQYIEFINSSMDKDAAQSTVPFIDIQDVTASPPVPLSGVGIYHKGRTGFGGFIAPKIMTYNFTQHIQIPKFSN